MKKTVIITLAVLAIAGCTQKKTSQEAQAAAAQAQVKAQTVKVMPAAKQDVKQNGS